MVAALRGKIVAMAGTISCDLDALPDYDPASGDPSIRVGENRWIAHRGTVTPPDGEPVWPLADVADVFALPVQGEWGEADLLRILHVNGFIEWTDGRLEFLPMPSILHQRLIKFLFRLLFSAVEETGRGEVLPGPFNVDVLPGKWREPDLAVMLAENAHRVGDESWQGADLVVEVVSPDDPRRDYERKRSEYAAAGIREYWIIDPRHRRFLLLSLDGDAYREAAVAEGTGAVASVLLDGLSVDLADLFNPAEGRA